MAIICETISGSAVIICNPLKNSSNIFYVFIRVIIFTKTTKEIFKMCFKLIKTLLNWYYDSLFVCMPTYTPSHKWRLKASESALIAIFKCICPKINLHKYKYENSQHFIHTYLHACFHKHIIRWLTTSCAFWAVFDLFPFIYCH